MIFANKDSSPDTTDKKSNKKSDKNKVMSRKEKRFLASISIVLVIAIIIVSVFLLYPKLAGRPDWQTMAFLNFNDSTWIEEMANSRLKPTDKMIDINSSFVYSADTAFITTNYASMATVEEARAYFLSKIPGAVENAENLISNMNITGTLQEEEIEIVNYEADMLNAFETKFVIDKDIAEVIKNKIIKEYPVEIVNQVPELAEIMKNEKLGGYLLYNDDELSSHSYAGVPIFSEAYRYGGTREELAEIQKTIEEKYTESIYFEDGETVYFSELGYIMSLSITESDLNILAVITVQKIPESAITAAE